jgi:hypothetical protein
MKRGCEDSEEGARVEWRVILPARKGSGWGCADWGWRAFDGVSSGLTLILDAD